MCGVHLFIKRINVKIVLFNFSQFYAETFKKSSTAYGDTEGF